MENHYRFLAVAVISSLLITRLYAADSGFYLGGGLGYTQFDTVETDEISTALSTIGTVASVEIDDTDFNWKVFAGYNFNKYFGFEAGYQSLGEIGLNTSVLTFVDIGFGPITIQNDNTIVRETDGFLLDGIVKYPLAERFQIYAKVGAYFWNVEDRLERAVATSPLFGTLDLTAEVRQAVGDLTEDGVSPMFGVGLSYDIWQRLTIRFDFDFYNDIDDDDAYAFQGGVQYNF